MLPVNLYLKLEKLCLYTFLNLSTEIEYNTILTEIVIGYICGRQYNNSILSFSDYTNKMSLEQFIILNRNFFPFMPITKNYYKIFVIDKMYMIKKHNNNNPVYKNREIKTNHWGDFKKILSHTKSLIYL